MAVKKKAEEKINLDSILFKCRDILRAARNSGSFFEKRDMMLTLVFLRFIGEKYEDGIENLRQSLIAQGLDPDDEEIRAAFFDDYISAEALYRAAAVYGGHRACAERIYRSIFLYQYSTAVVDDGTVVDKLAADA